ncbi:MAG: hypothetical protein RBT11_07420 [Desulfobacterales bacterium]|nr:hypothetical protein [Desulfobacterales bacterium]
MFEITNRWLSNELDPVDPLQITRIITYDSFVAWERLLLFIKELNPFLTNLTQFKRIATKNELKDFICNATDIDNSRVQHLISEYMKLPEFYYVGSPLAALAYYDNQGHMTGMCRFKRVKRIAEKASRYAALHIADKVRLTAARLATQIGKGNENAKELVEQAEKEHLLEFKRNGISLPAANMTIKDVLGLKLIKNGISEEQLESVISGLPGATIIEKEVHTGSYNAVHYVVELTVDLDYMSKRFKSRPPSDAYRYRGLPANNLSRDFEWFLYSGSNTVQVDLIFTTIEELVESEIGRSMHETRIFKQRRQQNVYGNITINIEYIIEYLLAVGMSPTKQIDDIPIKIWGRYLPDTLGYNIRKLYELPEYSIVDY